MNKPLLMGHRGAKGELPENTLASIKHALDLGLKHIEIDIHKSKDGYLVVIHDETLDRTTNSTGFVSEQNLSDLKKLDAGNNEQIPTLDEVILLIKNYNAHLQIEIKARNLEDLLHKEIEKFNFYDHCTVISFLHDTLVKTKEIDSKINIVPLLFANPHDPVQIIKSLNANGMSLSLKNLTRETVQKIKEDNYLVTAWNANNEQDYILAKNLGVDIIGTDNPSLLYQLPN